MPNNFEIGKAIHDIKGHLDTLGKFTKATERAAAGKDPFPPTNQVTAALKSLDALSRRLDNLARSGLRRPEEEFVGVGEFADPKERPAAMIKMFNNMQALETAVEEGGQLSKRLDNLRTQAEARVAACGTAIQFFEKLVKYPVGSVGTAMQAQAFEYVQLFEKAQVRLSSVATLAKKAQGRIQPEVANLGEELENFRTTVRTFTNGLQTTDVADNGLLPSKSEGSSIPPHAAAEVDTDGDSVPDQTQPDVYQVDATGVGDGGLSWYGDAQIQDQLLQQSQTIQPSDTFVNQHPICHPEPDDPGPNVPPPGWGNSR